MFILLTGYKRSGKDTVAEMLTKYLRERNVPVVHDSLALPIKQMANILSAGDTDSNEREELLSWGYTPRELWQWLGTEVFQKAICKRFPKFSSRIGRLIWCKLLYQRRAFTQGVTIISDCRFPHEIEFFTKAGAMVVRVHRYEIPWYKRIFLHESERHIPNLPADYNLDNGSSLEHLDNQVYRLANEIVRRSK